MTTLTCDCEFYEICPSCAPNEPAYNKAKEAHDRAAREVMKKSAIIVDLNRLRELMQEFLAEMETKEHAAVFSRDSLTDWKFETFLQWLRKRQGKVNGQS